MGVVQEPERVVRHVSLLLHLAEVLSLPVIPTTQYAKGLGPYVPGVAELVRERTVFDKLTFSALEDEAIGRELASLGRRELVLCGVETHICVYQTALSALEQGYRVTVAADATSSRTLENMRYGLERLRDLGVAVVSTEMVVYELLRRAGTPEFKAMLPHLK